MTKAITKDRRETRLTQEEYDEKIERFCLMDDRFMTKVFQDDKECIELILHILVGNPELRVTAAQAQYQIENLRGRSVRLDVYATDAAGKRYNIEVQRTDDGASAKRARYNSSVMDANALKKGEPVKNLPETYVIFITENDVLGEDKPIYHIDRRVLQTGEEFGDQAHIIYANASCQEDTPIGRLMHDFMCTDPHEMYYDLLREKTRYYKENEKGRAEMSGVQEELYQEGREHGRAEGREEGREEGRTEALMEERRKDVFRMLKKNFSIEQIADIKDMKVEDVRAFAAEVK